MKNQYYEDEPRLRTIDNIKKDFEGKEPIEIVCDHCGKHLCMAVDFDLEGSYFACDECYKLIKE